MDASDVSLYSESAWSSIYEDDSNIDDDAEGYYVDDEDAVVCSQQPPWDVITPANIQQHQNKLLSEVSEVLACPTSSARILLTEYRWDKTKLISCQSSPSAPAALSTPTVITCECCFCEYSPVECTAMSCGHWFCNECWRGYLRIQIREGQSCRLRCMGFKCGLMCDENMVLRLVGSETTVRERYVGSLLESYVNDNTNVKWCPSIPNCGNAVRNNRDECCEPICSCGLHFCFLCLGEAHSPCTCDMWAAWESKRRDDSETMNWITANTKPCPKCGKVVEKNGGCNLMTCRCGQHFCWLCGASTGREHNYHSIANHTCGRWTEDRQRHMDEASQNHKRYMHYFTRWNGHRDSLNKEERDRQDVLSCLKKNCDKLTGRVIEYNSLITIVYLLTAARKVLSNSYAFAYFLCGKDWYSGEIDPGRISMNKELFEDMQQQLEQEVEHLSKLVSNSDLDNEEEISQHISAILSCGRTVSKRMQNFFHAINFDLLGRLEQSVVSIADFTPRNL